MVGKETFEWAFIQDRLIANIKGLKFSPPFLQVFFNHFVAIELLYYASRETKYHFIFTLISSFYFVSKLVPCFINPQKQIFLPKICWQGHTLKKNHLKSHLAVKAPCIHWILRKIFGLVFFRCRFLKLSFYFYKV